MMELSTIFQQATWGHMRSVEGVRIIKPGKDSFSIRKMVYSVILGADETMWISGQESR